MKNIILKEQHPSLQVVKRISHGFAFLALSGIVNKVFQLFFIVLIANRLGQALFGRLQYLLTIVIIASGLSDMGLDKVAIREVARSSGRQKTTGLSVIISLRLFFLGLVVLFVLAISAWLFPSEIEKSMLPWVLLYLVLFSLNFGLQAFFRGFEKSQFQALTTVFEKCIWLALCGLFLYQNKSLPAFLLAYILASFLALLLGIGLFKFYIGPLRIAFDIKKWWAYFREALPFGLGAICILILCRQDTIMLRLLVPVKPEAEIGNYRAAYSLLDGLLFFPQVLAFAIYPVFSSLHKEKEQIREVASNLLRLSSILSFELAIIVSLSSSVIIPFLLPGFSSSMQVMQRLTLVLPFIYGIFLLGPILNATDGQDKNLLSSIVAMISNFFLNLHFIPKYGALGAAWATVLSQGLYCVGVYYFVIKKIGDLKLANWLPGLLLSTMLGAGMLYALLPDSFPLAIITSPVIYFLSLRLCGLLHYGDWHLLKSVLSSFKRK